MFDLEKEFPSTAFGFLAIAEDLLKDAATAERFSVAVGPSPMPVSFKLNDTGITNDRLEISASMQIDDGRRAFEGSASICLQYLGPDTRFMPAELRREYSLWRKDRELGAMDAILGSIEDLDDSNVVMHGGTRATLERIMDDLVGYIRNVYMALSDDDRPVSPPEMGKGVPIDSEPSITIERAGFTTF